MSVVDAAPATVRAAIYLRISQDRTGAGAGVSRQETSCRELALRNGWTVTKVYNDNDFSAFNGKRRPDYERMLQDIRDRVIDAVVVYDQDRLDKGGLEAEQFINLADTHRIRLASVGGDFDLSTDNGRLQYRVKAAFARAELERKSARQKAAGQQRAMRGKLHVAGRKSFGYQADGRTPDPAEKAAVVQAAQWVLDGVSLREVARRWNAAGLTTATGKPWAGELVSQFMVNPRLAGIRTYHREPVIVDGAPVRGEWEPLLDDDTWQALQAVLTDPRRRWPRTSNQLLLSGVATCGTCGGRINSGGRRQGNAKHGFRYRCTVDSSHINRVGDPVDRFVIDALLRRLSEPKIAKELSSTDEPADLATLRAESAALHQRMEGLSGAYADGYIDLGQLKSGTERLRSQLAGIEARATSARRSAATVRLVSATDVSEMWETFPLDVKRTIIGELMTIELFGPGQGIRYVSDEHVKIDWK